MNKRKYNLNENSFHELNNDSAYWIGFLYADGSCTNENKIRLYLQEKDKEILEKLYVWLGAYDRILRTSKTKYGVYKGVDVRSNKIKENLLKYSLHLRKETRPELNKDLFSPEIRKNFVRGYFDGDGSLYIDKRGYMFAEITGHYQVISDIKRILVLDKIIDASMPINKNGSIYRLRFCASKSIDFGNYIYQGANFFLKRKYDVFTSYLNSKRLTGVDNYGSDEM